MIPADELIDADEQPPAVSRRIVRGVDAVRVVEPAGGSGVGTAGEPDGDPDGSQIRLDSVAEAIARVAAGEAVVVVDDENRENEGDLIFAASRATPALMGFMIRHTSGVVCAPMPGQVLDRLHLPPMTYVNEDKKGTAYAISVDARDAVTTGISAADRAHTVRVLADSATEPSDITRPGHVFPLRAVDGGVLKRPGHTEAAVDLARLAGTSPVGVICELVHEDGSMMRAPACREFADEHGLTMISIADLITYIRHHDILVERVATAQLPTEHGLFKAHGYRDVVYGHEHLALVLGTPAGVAAGTPAEAADSPVGGADDVDDTPAPVVRLHSECLTGDVVGSLRCDCGPQLDAALARIGEEGAGVVVYLRGHEGRGIGLLPKLKAYELQDQGADTVEANLALGLPADSREYSVGAQILRDLGVNRVRLLTNNPDKARDLERHGITVVSCESIAIAPNPHNEAYLRTKAARMGHTLTFPETAPDTDSGGAP